MRRDVPNNEKQQTGEGSSPERTGGQGEKKRKENGQGEAAQPSLMCEPIPPPRPVSLALSLSLERERERLAPWPRLRGSQSHPGHAKGRRRARATRLASTLARAGGLTAARRRRRRRVRGGAPSVDERATDGSESRLCDVLSLANGRPMSSIVHQPAGQVWASGPGPGQPAPRFPPPNLRVE